MTRRRGLLRDAGCALYGNRRFRGGGILEGSARWLRWLGHAGVLGVGDGRRLEDGVGIRNIPLPPRGEFCECDVGVSMRSEVLACGGDKGDVLHPEVEG